MKTKYWWFYVFGGIYLSMAIGAQIGNKLYNGSSEAIVNLILIAFAVLSVGYGFKLRRLYKRGIESTKSNSRK